MRVLSYDSYPRRELDLLFFQFQIPTVTGAAAVHGASARRFGLRWGLGGERARVASFMRSALRVGVPVAELLDFIVLNMPTIAF